MKLAAILNECGLSAAEYRKVYGGDINECYRVELRRERFFLKLNEADRYPEMFSKEKAGLDALRSAGTIRVPEVLACGVVADTQFLLLEWLQPGLPTSGGWEQFGQKLAQIHLQQEGWFGWEDDNYIGSLRQRNTKMHDWATFYSECRILPLVGLLLQEKAFGARERRAAESLARRLNSLYPSEPSSLLHGDLWSGNFLFTESGNVALIDPAVYRGHREMDMAMTRLFGGFDPRFYSAYEEVFPLEKKWEDRLALSQLYPVLVHAVLFGGHYVAEARKILEKYSG
ncbi:MAG TPA: fructosamine kinase family protein [Chitinophagaceae bacterium]|nr:fructosamine kinase family protein [Chitinophagaceae bacterium]